MRATRTTMLLIACGAMVLVLAGCPKHENFPTQVTLVTAPAPDTFVITALGVNATGGFDYDLSWTVSDPTNVDRYRLYLVGAGLEPELVDEPTGTFLPVSLPFNAQGLQFGISTVSTGSVESALKIATIPPVPASN
jgi:hypothetical protein